MKNIPDWSLAMLMHLYNGVTFCRQELDLYSSSNMYKVVYFVRQTHTNVLRLQGRMPVRHTYANEFAIHTKLHILKLLKLLLNI